MLVATIDGYLLLASFGFLALGLVQGGFYTAVIAACLAAGAGALEVQGAQMLKRGDERGVDWLVRAQLVLLLVILGFVIYHLSHFDGAFFRSLIPQMRANAAEMYPRLGLEDPYPKVSDSELLMVMRFTLSAMLIMAGFVSCVYQGLMAWYYHKRRGAVTRAIDIIYGEEAE